jgi:glycine betaine/proline transport system substrate-binding protein
MAFGAVVASIMATAARAGDPGAFRTVRFSDVGWTDLQATNGVANVVRTAVGYKPEFTVVSMPITHRR